MEGGDQGRATDKEEVELDKMDKALATKATTKEELEFILFWGRGFADALPTDPTDCTTNMILLLITIPLVAVGLVYILAYLYG